MSKLDIAFFILDYSVYNFGKPHQDDAKLCIALQLYPKQLILFVLTYYSSTINKIIYSAIQATIRPRSASQ